MHKVYNPTFIEILDDVKDNNQTLGSLLIYWYMTKYGINEDRLDESMKYLRESLYHEEKKEEQPKVIYKYINDDGYNYTCGGSNEKYSSASCSYDDDSYDYSCGGGYRTKHRDDRC